MDWVRHLFWQLSLSTTPSLSVETMSSIQELLQIPTQAEGFLFIDW